MDNQQGNEILYYSVSDGKSILDIKYSQQYKAKFCSLIWHLLHLLYALNTPNNDRKRQCLVSSSY